MKKIYMATEKIEQGDWCIEEEGMLRKINARKDKEEAKFLKNIVLLSANSHTVLK